MTILTSNDHVRGAGNRILRNSIFSDLRLGIDLGADGPTANHFLDFDTVPTTCNKPVLASAIATPRSSRRPAQW